MRDLAGLDRLGRARLPGSARQRDERLARETAGADVVTTLIDTGSAYGTTGVGWALNSTDFAAFAGHAYNVCAVRAVESGHMMTHEVSHNMGAGHATAVNPATCSPGPQLYDCSAGYYFTGTDNVSYHTIMAYNADGYGKTYVGAPLFSSPDCSWAGTVAGDDDHDNAWTLRFCRASGRRTLRGRSTASAFFRNLVRFHNRLTGESMTDLLSPREFYVATALTRGLKYKEIAERLGIAYCRVNDLITTIHDKLDIHGSNELKSFV